MDLRYSRLRQHSCHRGKLDFCSFSLLADRQTRRHSDVVYIILLRVNRHLEEFRAARGTSRVSSFAFRGAIRLGLCVVVLPRRISTRLELSSAGPVRGTACARARFLVIGRLPPRPRSVPVNLLFPLGNFLFRESSRAGIDRSISAYSLIGGNRERLPVCVCVCVCVLVIEVRVVAGNTNTRVRWKLRVAFLKATRREAREVARGLVTRWSRSRAVH